MAELRPDVETRGAELPLNRLLGQVERRVSRLLEPILVPEGLTVDQWRVLDLLSDGVGHPMSDIAGRIVVPAPTLTKLIDKLVDAAAVYRLVDGRDRRRVLAFISDNGRTVHSRLHRRVADVEAGVLTGIGPDGPVLLALLARLSDDDQS